jgi:hypothetical protein
MRGAVEVGVRRVRRRERDETAMKQMGPYQRLSYRVRNA